MVTIGEDSRPDLDPTPDAMTRLSQCDDVDPLERLIIETFDGIAARIRVAVERWREELQPFAEHLRDALERLGREAAAPAAIRLVPAFVANASDAHVTV